jgi:DNA-binding NtrC family response regulator
LPTAKSPRAHVVLESCDRRYVRLAAFFLARRGYQVTTAASLDQVIDAVGMHGADAVIVDGSSAPSTTAAVLGRLRTLHPSIGVILVVDDNHRATPGAHGALGKWTSARSLAQAVERARQAETDRSHPPIAAVDASH